MLFLTVALARHTPSGEVFTYDEDTCDVTLGGVRCIQLRHLFTGEVSKVAPVGEVQVISALE